MSAVAWLLVFAVVVAGVWVVGAVADACSFGRIRLPRIGQPVRAKVPLPPVPPLPPSRIDVDMSSARTARAERGRHRHPQQ